MKNEIQLHRVFGAQALCIDEGALRGMLAELPLRSAMSPDQLRAMTSPVALGTGRAAGDKGAMVAIISIAGVIEKTPSILSWFFGGSTVDGITAALRECLADPAVSAIVLDVNSPGGTVTGIGELADEIFQARKQKPITAVANGQMCSAAYYLGSQASEVLASPSSMMGSVGVYMMHEDDSQLLDNVGVKMTFISYGDHKTEANPYEPLTDEAKAHLQSMVDEHGQAFEKAVARGRKISADEVHRKFGKGRALTASNAVKVGMADRMGTIDDALAKHGAKRSGLMRAAIEAIDIHAAAFTASEGKKTKRVDSEDLELEAFAYRGSKDDTSQWKLPIEFSTDEKSKKHIRLAIADFPKTEMEDADEKERAWDRIKAAAKKHGIEVSDDDKGEKDKRKQMAAARDRELQLISL
jgi:signal peptide peptidase SppA